MDIKNFERAKQYAIQRLERELPSNLYYHGILHTRDDVVPAVERLAGMEGIRGESLSLLLTAAWFHDIGYVEQNLDHEVISARIAMQVLPGFGYTDKQIEVIRGAILATAVPQAPVTILEQILVDADMDVLGREDFMSRNRDLRREFAALGRSFADIEWYTDQLKFMETHAYFTASARKTRDESKRENINRVKRLLEELA